MARLARDHENLTSVVSFVRDEVGQNVADVERKIAPDISFGWRDLISVSKSELEKRLHRRATAFQRDNQVSRINLMMIDTRWRRDTVLPAERLKPPAPGVVEMSSDGTDGPPRDAWNRYIPERRRQGLDELRRDAIIRAPGGE